MKKTKKEENFNRPDGENGELKFVASQTSVTLGRNSKGQPTIEVKVYDFDPDRASKKAQELFKQLDKALPFD